MINQVVVVGRLLRDPELRVSQDGVMYSGVTLVVPRNYRDANGKVGADYVYCKLFRKVAENTAKYCTAGSYIGITGSVHSRSYDGADGRRTYVTEIIGDSVHFLPRNTASSQAERQAVQPTRREEVTTPVPLPSPITTHPSQDRGAEALQGGSTSFVQPSNLATQMLAPQGPTAATVPPGHLSAIVASPPKAAETVVQAEDLPF